MLAEELLPYAVAVHGLAKFAGRDKVIEGASVLGLHKRALRMLVREQTPYDPEVPEATTEPIEEQIHVEAADQEPTEVVLPPAEAVGREPTEAAPPLAEAVVQERAAQAEVPDQPLHVHLHAEAVAHQEGLVVDQVAVAEGDVDV